MKVAHTVSVVLTLFEVPGPQLAPSESKPPQNSLLTLFLIALGAFTPALEAMNSWSQEEACHDGHHRHWYARENDDEQIC